MNSELKRLKSQFSKAKRENEILKQVKDTLSKRLQVEEQRTKELQRESQRSRKDSASTSQYESEIRELRTKLAIAEAEREAAGARSLCPVDGWPFPRPPAGRR